MSPWLDSLRRTLSLRRAPEHLLVVDAADTWLPTLLRALRADGYVPRVCLRGASLFDTPSGHVAVYVPDPEELPALNELRPRVVAQGLFVIFWCTSVLARSLRALAPDLHDLVSRTFHGDPRVADHAVAGVRAAALAGAPGVLWQGRGDAADAISRAFPGASLTRASAQSPHEAVVEAARAPRCSWIVWGGADGAATRRRLRRCLAEAGRSHRSVMETSDEGREPGWWSVSDRMASLDAAVTSLSSAADAPTLAVLCGLETEAITLAAGLLDAGVDEASLSRPLWTASDPGAALAFMAHERGLVDSAAIAQTAAPAPVLRALARRRRGATRAWMRTLGRQVQAGESVSQESLSAWAARSAASVGAAALRDSRTRATFIEAALRDDPPAWRCLALAALLVGSEEAAVHWSRRSEREPGVIDAAEREVLRVLLREIDGIDLGMRGASHLAQEALRFADALRAVLGEVPHPWVRRGPPVSAHAVERPWSLGAVRAPTAAPSSDDIVSRTERLLSAVGWDTAMAKRVSEQIAAARARLKA